MEREHIVTRTRTSYFILYHTDEQKLISEFCVSYTHSEKNIQSAQSVQDNQSCQNEQQTVAELCQAQSS